MIKTIIIAVSIACIISAVFTLACMAQFGKQIAQQVTQMFAQSNKNFKKKSNEDFPNVFSLKYKTAFRGGFCFVRHFISKYAYNIKTIY